ncbi:MAG TPA: hypothetical protein VE243_11630, partial [Candidatus Acidoferrum sp.]|nr:hypothetical protein [Candidatus Acidoferrum sp.]
MASGLGVGHAGELYNSINFFSVGSGGDEMREVRQIVVTIALATAAAMFSSGCPAMMVPGLAYSGYKYAHDKNNPQTASNTQSGKSATTSSSTHNAKST